MGWFSDDSDQAQAYDQVSLSSAIHFMFNRAEVSSLQVTSAPHKAEISHELLGAAAAYEVRSYCSFRIIPSSAFPLGRQGLREARRCERPA